MATNGGSGSGVNVNVGADLSRLRQEFQQAQTSVDRSLTEIVNRLGQLGDAANRAEREIQNTGNKMSGSFSGAAGAISGSITGLITKIGGLVAAYAGLQAIMGGFSGTRQLIDDTDALAQNMGVSAERASAYREALQGLDIGVDTFTAASGKMMETLSSNQGIFEKWGVAVRDSNGNLKSQEELFQSTLTRIGEFKDGSDRAAAAQKLLGVDLDTANKLLLLNKENIDAGAAAAEQYGSVVSGDMVSANDDLKAAMVDMNAALDGLKLAFFSNLIPAVTAFIDVISSNLPAAIDFLKGASLVVIGVFEDVWDIGAYIFEQIKSVMESFFSETGVQSIDWSAAVQTAMDVVKAAIVIIVGTFQYMATAVKAAAEIIGIAIGFIVQSVMDLANLNPRAIAGNFTTAMEMAAESSRKANAEIAKNIANIRTNLANIGNGVNIASSTNPLTGLREALTGGGTAPSRPQRYNTNGPTGGTRVTNENVKGGGGGGGGNDEASKLIKAQTDLIEAELNAQLDLMREKNRQEKNMLDEQLRSNEISYRDYYARIGEMAKAESQKQIEIKQKELEALEKLQKTAKNESDKVAVQAQIVKLQSEINVLKEKEGEIDRENARALKQKMEDLKKMRIDLANELSQTSGIMNFDAEFAAVEERYRDMKERMTAEGDTEGLGMLEKLLGYKKADLQIQEFQQKYDLLQTNIRTREIELETQAKRRGTTDATLQKQKLALQREELDNLIELKQKQLEIAEAAYGSGSIQVAQIRQSIAELQSMKVEANEVAKSIKQTVADGFTGLFNDIMNGTKSAKEMFEDFVGSVVQGINRIVAEALSKRLMQTIESIGSAGGGAAGGGGGGFFASIASIFARANGGFVSPGQPYQVGEEGPELFIPRTSGDIVNARDFRQMMADNNRRAPPSVQVNISTPDPHAFRKTQTQVMAELSKTVTRANNRNN